MNNPLNVARLSSVASSRPPSSRARVNWTRPKDLPQMETIHDTAFERCERIAPVAIVYGSGARLHVSEHNSSRRLLKELWRLGRSRIRVRGMISEKGALDRQSLWALNAYLEHAYGRETFRAVRAGGLHRFRWYGLQSAVALRWVR